MPPAAAAEGAGPAPNPQALATVTAGSTEPHLMFRVELHKTKRGSLGIDVTYSPTASWTRNGVFVTGVFEDGLVAKWNAERQEPRCVCSGDFIFQVNGVHSDTASMIQEMKVKQTLTIHVMRRSAAPPGVWSGARGIQRNITAQASSGPRETRPTVEELLQQFTALPDKALAGLMLMALEKREWIRDEVFGQQARGDTGAPPGAAAAAAAAPQPPAVTAKGSDGAAAAGEDAAAGVGVAATEVPAAPVAPNGAGSPAEEATECVSGDGEGDATDRDAKEPQAVASTSGSLAFPAWAEEEASTADGIHEAAAAFASQGPSFGGSTAHAENGAARVDMPALKVAAGNCCTAALTSAGRVLCWGSGQDRYCNVPSLTPPESFAMVAAGGKRTAALTSAGRVLCWGDLRKSRCGNVPDLTPPESFVMVAAGSLHMAALTSAGRVLCWGSDGHGRCSKVPSLTPPESFVMVAAGSLHMAALTSAGRVICWGRDGDGQLSVPDELQ